MHRLMIALLTPFLLYGLAHEWMRMIADWELTPSWQAFMIGAFLFTLFYLFFRRHLQFFEILEHELTHTIAGLICLHRPKSLSIEETGGSVTLTGSNRLIKLAPYIFPTIPFFLILLASIVSPVYRRVVLTLLGAAIAWHVISTLSEFHLGQEDLIRAGCTNPHKPCQCLTSSQNPHAFIVFREAPTRCKAGLLFVMIITPLSNLALTGSILAFVAGDLTGYWLRSLTQALRLGYGLLKMLMHAV